MTQNRRGRAGGWVGPSGHLASEWSSVPSAVSSPVGLEGEGHTWSVKITSCFEIGLQKVLMKTLGNIWWTLEPSGKHTLASLVKE